MEFAVEPIITLPLLGTVPASSRLVRRNGTLPTDHFSVSVFLDKIDILMSNTKLVLKVNTWLGCERHSRTQQSFMVSFVKVRRFVR